MPEQAHQFSKLAEELIGDLRQVGDPGWPSPVWGRNEPELTPESAAERLLRLQHCLRVL